ncbi:MAG: hypothetical protein HRT36_06625 [Alphaproteobacteria bacterium]|nr:hypothetical protein [Alphaproteobacteria bacterium]
MLCLIYHRIYTSRVFIGLLFGVSSPTVCQSHGGTIGKAISAFLSEGRFIRG